MTQLQNATDSQKEAMRDMLLAQMRVTRAELLLTQNHLEFIGSALANRLVTPHQAMQMAYDRDVLDWIFGDRNDVKDGLQDGAS